RLCLASLFPYRTLFRSGVGGRWDAHMLAIAEGFGKIPFELAAVVGLPDQIAQRDAVAMQMLLDAGGENGAGGSAALLGEGPEHRSEEHTSELQSPDHLV